VTAAPDARALIKKYGVRAKKSWGQNFLVDERAYRAIVEACEVGAGDTVVEIGAGLGTLTQRLAATGARVIAVERDRDMVAILRAELGAHAGVEIADTNALELDYAATGAQVACGNLPYQIASPLLFRLLEARGQLRRIVVMLQLEMAERIVAAAATPAYGALSVMVQRYAQVRLVCRVRAGAFVPAPKVDSAVIRLTPHVEARDPDRETWFSRVVHAAFNPRRKTLRNTLRAVAPAEVLGAALERLSIDPGRRGETLTVSELQALADALRGQLHA
jgi:16S rRNA (adenine1518-N6/adenine1519-N6)-dimethyltransferase